MAALIIRLPDGKRERLKDLARARKQSVTKLFDEMATVLLAEYDAETRFHVRAARGAGKTGRGLQLLDGLASRWGTRRVGAGKAIWFELQTEAAFIGPQDGPPPSGPLRLIEVR